MKPKSPNPLIIIGSIVALGSLALFLALFFFIRSQPPVDDPDGTASQSAVEQGNKERDTYPLLNYLPIQNAVYTIGYQFEEDGIPTIIIDTTDYYRDFAMEKLKSLATPEHPLSSYRVRFIDTYTTK